MAARLWHLLTLDVNGRTYRFTDSPNALTVTDMAARAYTYEPGLDPLVTGTGAASSVGIVVNVGAVAGVSWARMVARGHHLERAPARLARWTEGETLERARTVIVGHLTGVGFGSAFEPLTGTIERLLREGGTVPPRSWVIDATTWPVTALHTLDADVTGSQGPMILGTPTGAIVPGYLVEYRAAAFATCKVVFAYHPVEATTVTLHDPEGDWSASRTVQTMVDLLGRTVSYVDFNGLAYAPEEGREYRIAFNQSTGAGLMSGGRGLTGAGEIIEYLLRSWSDVAVDWSRFSAQRQALDAYRLGIVLVDQVSTWDVVRQIVDLLPFDWAESEAGIWLAPWRLDATTERARGHIDCSPGGPVDRVGPVQMSGGAIYNRFSISYKPDGKNLRPSRTAMLGGAPLPGEVVSLTDARARPSLLCTISRGLWGERPMSAISTELVHEEATAQLILSGLARRHALSRRALQVVGSTDLDRYDDGDEVTVTATDLEITAEPAVIKAKAIEGDRVTLTLVLADDPTNRQRPVTA